MAERSKALVSKTSERKFLMGSNPISRANTFSDSSVGLERLSDTQEVVGSSPTLRTWG